MRRVCEKFSHNVSHVTAKRWQNGDNSGSMTNEVALSLQNQRKRQLNIHKVWQIHKKTSQCAKLNIKADLKRKSNKLQCDIKCKTDESMCKAVKIKASCGDELDLKWRVIVQDCQQEVDSMHKFVKKKTSWSEKLTTKMGWDVDSKIKSRFRARI